MDDVFSRPLFGSDRYYERAWWTGTIGVNAEPLTASEPIGPPARTLPVGKFPHGVAVADLNGDGKRDIVTNNGRFADTVSVLLGQGGGSFAPAVDLKVGTQPTEVAIADLNGDGKPDLATSNWMSGDVSVLIGTGTGSFRAARSVGTGGAGPGSIAIRRPQQGRQGRPRRRYARSTSSRCSARGTGRSASPRASTPAAAPARRWRSATSTATPTPTSP